MEKDVIFRAKRYYELLGEKRIEELQEFLSPDVEWLGPLATLKGRSAVVEANRNFAQVFTSLTIRTKFSSGNQAMIVYDVDIPGISNEFPGASLLSFQNGVIVRIQLFYDGSRFREKKHEIF